MNHSIKNPFPLAGKTASAVRNRKMEENWFTPKLKNCIHQQKKAPNKNTRFVINRKSVSTSQNEGLLEKCYFTGPKSYFHSNQYLIKKIEKPVSSSRNKIFLKYWLPSNCNNGLNKKVNERLSFRLKRKSGATCCNKGFV